MNDHETWVQFFQFSTFTSVCQYTPINNNSTKEEGEGEEQEISSNRKNCIWCCYLSLREYKYWNFCLTAQNTEKSKEEMKKLKREGKVSTEKKGLRAKNKRNLSQIICFYHGRATSMICRDLLRLGQAWLTLAKDDGIDIANVEWFIIKSPSPTRISNFLLV